MNADESSILFSDGACKQVLSESEQSEIRHIVKSFIESYIENLDRPVKEWLTDRMKDELSDRSEEEIQFLVENIISTIEDNDERKQSLERAIENGKSKESWFASEVNRSGSDLPQYVYIDNLKRLNNALDMVNQSAYTAIATQAEGNAQNQQTDHFIEDRQCAQTFNLASESDENNWNEFQIKDLAMGIGKKAGYTAIQSAAEEWGYDIFAKAGERIVGGEVLEKVITNGADFGIKAATAGALKAGAEKEMIRLIPKGTPVGTVANIAYIAMENMKIMGKVASGEATAREGLNKMEQVTVSAAAGLVAMGEGTAIGSSAGMIFGPIGSAVGGFLGGTVGYMAGSKIGETVTRGVQKIRDTAMSVIDTVMSGVENVASMIGNGVKTLLGTFLDF